MKRTILALCLAFLFTIPTYAECGIGGAVDDFNASADHSMDDWAHVLKLVINQLNDSHHDLDYDACTVKEIKKADGFLGDYIDFVRHNGNGNSSAAINYARSVQARMHDEIERKEAGN